MKKYAVKPAPRLCAWDKCESRSLLTRSVRGNEYYQKFCREHMGAHQRKLSIERKGMRYHDKDGYIMMRPDKNSNLVLEHRYVMEKKLGRKLKRGESVHHVNGIRDDNRPENLELWVGPIRYGQRAKDIVCHNCGEPYHQ